MAVHKGETQVSHVAKELPKLPGTTVKKSFIRKRESSWQLHLQRISPFLKDGEGVWWTATSEGFHFRDGDDDSNQQGTFILLHHRCHSLKDLEDRRAQCWKEIISKKIEVPAEQIKIYDEQEMLRSRLVYTTNSEDSIARENPLEALQSGTDPPENSQDNTGYTLPPALPQAISPNDLLLQNSISTALAAPEGLPDDTGGLPDDTGDPSLSALSEVTSTALSAPKSLPEPEDNSDSS